MDRERNGEIMMEHLEGHGQGQGQGQGRQVNVRWSSFNGHAATLVRHSLLQEYACDVTLVSARDHGRCRLHRLILAASSPLFRAILEHHAPAAPHPVIVLQDIGTPELEALVSYIYNGEVTVPEADLAHFLKSAQALKIKGLVDDETRCENIQQNNPSQRIEQCDGPHELVEDTPFQLQPKVEPPDMCETILDELMDERDICNFADGNFDVKTDSENVEECRKKPVKRKSSRAKKRESPVEEYPEKKICDREENSPEIPHVEEEDGESGDADYQNEFENSIRHILNRAVNEMSRRGEDDPDSNVPSPTEVYSNPRFPCPFCPRIYHSWGYRRRHVKTRHGTNNLACKWCMILLGSQSEWFEHTVNMHGLTKTEARDSLVVMVEAHAVLTSMSPTPSTLIDQLEIEKFDATLEEKV